MLLEGDEAHVVGSRGYPSESAAQILSLRLPLSKTRNLQEMVETGKPVIIPDVLEDPFWLRTAVIDKQRSSLGAPIQHRGKTIGFISLDGYTPNVFTPADAEHLYAFTDQAAIALENARLFQETEKQWTVLPLCRVVEQAISSSFDLRITLHVLLDQLTTRLSIEAASILMLNPSTKLLELGASAAFVRLRCPMRSIRLGESLAGRVAFERATLNLPNLADFPGKIERKGLVVDEGFGAYYGVPLVIRGL